MHGVKSCCNFDAWHTCWLVMLPCMLILFSSRKIFHHNRCLDHAFSNNKNCMNPAGGRIMYFLWRSQMSHPRFSKLFASTHGSLQMLLLNWVTCTWQTLQGSFFALSVFWIPILLHLCYPSWTSPVSLMSKTTVTAVGLLHGQAYCTNWTFHTLYRPLGLYLYFEGWWAVNTF